MYEARLLQVGAGGGVLRAAPSSWAACLPLHANSLLCVSRSGNSPYTRECSAGTSLMVEKYAEYAPGVAMLRAVELLS